MPPQSARSALVKAARLAPFDLGLAFQVGHLFASEGSVAAAIGVLQPIAANPHGSALSRQAQSTIEFLRTQPEGVPVNFGSTCPLLKWTWNSPQAGAPKAPARRISPRGRP